MSSPNCSQSSEDNDVNAEIASFSVDIHNHFDTEQAPSSSVNENDKGGRGFGNTQCKSGKKSNNRNNKKNDGKKKKSKHGRRSARGQDKANADGIGEVARKKLLKAFENPVVFEHFSVTENLHSLLKTRQPLPDNPLPCTLYWNGDEPKVAVDRDRIPILVYLPGLFSDDDNRYVCDTMTLFHNNNESRIRPKASGSSARNKHSNFRQEQGSASPPMIGVVELGIVVEQGHSYQEPRASLANFGNSVTAVSESSALNQSFNFCRAAANSVLSFVDPAWFVALSSIHDGLYNASSSNRLIQGQDPSLLPSHTVTWDRHINAHFDTKDHPRGWSALSVYGTFKLGGDLFIPTLGLSMRFTPQDFSCIRGTMLKHQIMPFQDGHRFAHTSYFPYSMFKHYERRLPTPLDSMCLSSVDEICTSLRQTHRVRRRILEGSFSQKREETCPYRRRVEMRMEQNQKDFGERQRRANLRGRK